MVHGWVTSSLSWPKSRPWRPADVLGAILAASVTGHLYQEEGDGHAGHEEEED
jgi:hypothetical protein